MLTSIFHHHGDPLHDVFYDTTGCSASESVRQATRRLVQSGVGEFRRRVDAVQAPSGYEKLGLKGNRDLQDAGADPARPASANRAAKAGVARTETPPAAASGMRKQAATPRARAQASPRSGPIT